MLLTLRGRIDLAVCANGCSLQLLRLRCDVKLTLCTYAHDVLVCALELGHLSAYVCDATCCCGHKSALYDVFVICNMCCPGTSLMEEVFINQEKDPYVLEADGRLDLAALQLQPASIVINRSVKNSALVAESSWPTSIELQYDSICSKKGLVDAQTSKTKRSFADIQQKVLHDTTAGSKANSLKVSGASVAGKSSMSMRKRYVARLWVGCCCILMFFSG